MAEINILSDNQKNILDIISKDKMLCDNFYLTGGTALAGFFYKRSKKTFV